MSAYNLKVTFGVGSGVLTVNGIENQWWYNEGDSLTLAVTLDSGWTGGEWFLNGVSQGTASSFTFSMPARNSTVRYVATGAFQPTNDYALRFFGSGKQKFEGGQCINLEIYKFNYVGPEENLKIQDISYKWGNLGDDILKTIKGSSVDFTIAGERDQFLEFLEGDNRTWKVVLKVGIVPFWTGFIRIDQLTMPFRSGIRLQKFTASDGFDSLGAIRVNQLIFPGATRDRAISAIVGALNQSFKEFRNVNIICDFFETRMDRDLGLFEQFLTPDNAIFTDGSIQRFTDNGNVIFNDTIYISEALNRLLNPFLCRVFLYEDKFWIVRMPDMKKSIAEGFEYDPETEVVGPAMAYNNLVIDCNVNLPEETARRVFTEFTSLLKLGVLLNETKGSVYEADFSSDEWIIGSQASPYPGRFILTNWDYVRARPSNQPTSVPSGDEALIQYATDSGSDSVKIWTTTTSSGISDPNISYIVLSTDSTGRKIEVAEEVANTIGVSFEYLLQSVSSTNPRTEAAHSVGIMVKVGSSYLQRVGATGFDWTTTPTICQFNGLNSSVNSVNIPNLLVPETGEVEIRLYQLILNSAIARHQYALHFRKLKINIEQNEALQLNDLSTKAKTDLNYSFVAPVYETFIGDAVTKLSTSAINLTITDNPVSEAWSRDGVESEPLLDLICVELANLQGVKNRRIITTLERLKPYPYEAVQYDGRLWMIVHMEWSPFLDRWRIELYELGPIPTT
jgi:hypothetical protein